MKKISLIFLISILYISCTKSDKSHKVKYRYMGYVYNSQDSLPFANTQFKFYYQYHSLNNILITGDSLFTTDNKGYFDVSFDNSSGASLCWPAYFSGAAYLGPPMMFPKRVVEDVNNYNFYYVYYDTAFTTPYY